MDTRDLKIFISTAATENYRQTARDHGISQAAVSQRIRAIETELGVNLFRKSGRGVEITDAGKALSESAHRVLAEMEDMSSVGEMLRRNELGRIAIGYSTSIMSERRLPLVLRQFAEAHPSIELRPNPMLVTDAIDALIERRIDLAVVRAPLPPLPADLGSSMFDKARLMLAVPNGDPLAGGRQIGWNDLDGKAILMMRDPDGVGLREVTMKLLTQHDVRPGNVRLIGDMTTLVGLVASGVGVALLPEDIARSHRGVTTVKIGTTPSTVDAVIVTRRPIITAIVRHLVSRLEQA